MLSKLLKYEFKSTGRIFGVCYIGVLAAALLLRMMGALAWVNLWDDQEADTVLLPISDIAANLSMMLYAIMIVAVIVVTFIMILQRFYKNLLGGEGYLMHTLPVKPWEHIASKLIAAMAWTVLSTIVVVLSVCILAMTGELFTELVSEFGEFMRYFYQNFNTPLFLIILELCLVVLVSTASSILQIYAAIMIGHQAAKHKIALAVGAYFGIGMVINVALSLLLNLVSFIVPDGIWNVINFMETMDPVQGFHLIMLALLAFNLVLGAVFFFVTEHMMRRNLNLE